MSSTAGPYDWATDPPDPDWSTLRRVTVGIAFWATVALLGVGIPFVGTALATATDPAPARSAPLDPETLAATVAAIDPAGATATAQAVRSSRPVRVQVAGDSTGQWHLDEALQAVADSDHSLEWASIAPNEWTAPDPLSMARAGCPLVDGAPMWRRSDSDPWGDVAAQNPTGAGTCDWARWVPSQVVEAAPDVVVASWGPTGAWERWAGTGPPLTLDDPTWVATTRATMEAFEAATAPARVLWLPWESPTTPFGYRDAWADLVDERPWSMPRSWFSPDWLLDDGVHLSMTGATLAARWIAAEISSNS